VATDAPTTGLPEAAAARGETETGASGDVPDRRAPDLQWLVGRLLAPLWVPLAAALMRLGFGWRIRDAARHRAAYARLLAQDRRPLLIAANHLTMVDSCIIAWGLGSSLGHVLRYRGLPWNAPLQARVESSWLWRALAYVMKCVPVPRGGDRQAVAGVLERLRRLMRSGEAVLLFPEAGRSRTGRVDTASVAQGVGRLVHELGDCRVLCVYLRGDAQRTYSTVPARGDTFTLATRLVEPRTELRGVRASRDLAMQVLDQLVEMEREYFEARG
jgi:1-acyl-sn-glycerol-3-phosphate acyltransferase